MPRKPTPSLIILTVLLTWAVVRQCLSALSWGHGSYQMTDWLTNYAGGFVRRGLPGTILGFVSDISGLQANHLAIGFSFICYLLLVSWFLRKSPGVFPAVLILSCIVMGFPAYQDTLVRKDCLCLLLFLACLKTAASGIPRSVAMVSINVIAAAAILCHESFVFFALPALVFCGGVDESSATLKDLLRRSLGLLPAFIVFLLTAKYHGNPEIATAVHESWLPLWREIEPAAQEMAPGASIRALGWTTGEGVYLSWYMITSGIYQPFAWSMVFAISLLLVLLFTGRDHETDAVSRSATRTRFTPLATVQLLFMAPLFLLGVDWGRWLFLWIASTMMLQLLGRKAPDVLEKGVARLFQRYRLDVCLERVPVKDWYLLAFGVPVCWSMDAFLIANPILRSIAILRTWF